MGGGAKWRQLPTTYGNYVIEKNLLKLIAKNGS